MDSPEDDEQYSAWTQGVRNMGFWKYWLSTLSPERLEKQRFYDRERHQRYREEHKEAVGQKAKELYVQNKDRLQAKPVCELCGGRYKTQHRTQHMRTKRHKLATKNTEPCTRTARFNSTRCILSKDHAWYWFT